MMKYKFLAGLIAFGTACNAQSFENTLDQVRTQNNLVGLAVGVICVDDTLATYYGGMANVSSASPIAAATMFRIASISKTFTAVGLMRLYDQGLFDLDEDVSATLGYTLRNPAFPDQAITFRMLLSHTSSLQDGTGYNNFLTATFGGNAIPNISELVLPGGAYFTANMWRTEVPGSFFAYSNVNFGVLGTLIEKLSNTRFDLHMKNEVLDPLGIIGGFNVSELENIENVAVLYRNNVPQQDNYGGVNPAPLVDDTYVPGLNGLVYGPQGGLRTNLYGVLTLGKTLAHEGIFNGEPFLASATVALMLSDQWTYNGQNGDNYFGLFNSWGLGIHRAVDNNTADEVIADQVMLGHPGEAYGLISDLYFDPSSRFVLAFITNGYSSGGNYDFGQNSSFYAPEEETFDAIESNFWNTCQTLSTSSYRRAAVCDDLKYTPQNRSFSSPDVLQNHQAEVFDLMGRSIKIELEKGFGLAANYNGGIAVVRITAADGVCVRKFWIGN